MALPGDEDSKVGSVQFSCWLFGYTVWGNCCSLCTVGSGSSLPCHRLGMSENEHCRSVGHLLEGGCVTEQCGSVLPVSLGSCNARAWAIAKSRPAGLKKVKCLFQQVIPQNSEQENGQHPSNLSSFMFYTCLKNTRCNYGVLREWPDALFPKPVQSMAREKRSYVLG